MLLDLEGQKLNQLIRGGECCLFLLINIPLNVFYDAF